MDDIFKKVEEVILSRKSASADESYVASLNQKGIDAILKKIAEESSEVIMATKDDSKSEIIHEVADLIFHLLVLLGYKDISTDEIGKELSNRFGTSGIEEKKNRNK